MNNSEQEADGDLLKVLSLHQEYDEFINSLEIKLLKYDGIVNSLYEVLRDINPGNLTIKKIGTDILR